MLFIVIFSNLGDWTLLLFTGIAILLILLISFLAPKFAKIFNKFTPLEEGNLRTKLLDLLNSHGYSVKEIKVMDASKRSTKSNAYFSGLGKTKTIVLYDTLLNNMSEEEIIAIFAHELGHGLHKDIIKNTLLSFLNIALIVIIAWLNARYPQIYGDFGFNNVNYAFALILLLAVELPIISPFMGIISSAFSRKAEYKADEQAVKEGYGKELITSLKKLTKENFGNLSPNKIVVLLEYSHPTVSQRIEQIEKKMVNND